MLPQHQINITK